MIITPSLWQLAPFLYHTLYKLDIPLLHISPTNLQVIEQALVETDTTVVCTTVETLNTFFKEFKDPSILDRVTAWHIVSPLNNHTLKIERDLAGEVYIDFQLFPGLTIATAEYNTITHKLGELSYTNDHYLEFNSANAIVSVTSLQCVPLPLLRFTVI